MNPPQTEAPATVDVDALSIDELDARRLARQAEMDAEAEQLERADEEEAARLSRLRMPKTLADLGNAELLVHMHGWRLRWAPHRQQWLVWNGRWWQYDEKGEAERAAKDTARDLQRLAAQIDDDTERRKATEWAVKSQGARQIMDMLRLARSEPGITVSHTELDSHPWLLACANGTLDLKTGTFRDSRPEDLITRGTNVEYHPAAPCPRFDKFLGEVFAGDADLIEFIQHFAGYCLTGSTREQVLPVFHGSGCNGKTTLVKVLAQLLGDLAATAPFSSFIRTRNDGPRDDLARLPGARLVTASESGEGKPLDEAIVKQVTGGDTIACRPLHGKYIEFQPAFKLILVTNHLPRVDGDDDAIWRRLRSVPFTESFEGREDRNLDAQLTAELPGILAWAVRGCVAWQEAGELRQSAAVKQATAEYRADEDTIGTFLAERTAADPDAKTACNAVWLAYEQWCEEAAVTPHTRGSFSKRLALRPWIRVGQDRDRLAKGVRGYGGIRLVRVTDDR